MQEELKDAIAKLQPLVEMIISSKIKEMTESFDESKIEQECIEWTHEVYLWQYNNSESFNSKLLSLFSKADANNQLKLASSYPVAFLIWFCWREAVTEPHFFEMFLPEKDWEILDEVTLSNVKQIREQKNKEEKEEKEKLN